MELKSCQVRLACVPAPSFNRTAYGIEINILLILVLKSPELLIAPLMELK